MQSIGRKGDAPRSRANRCTSNGNAQTPWST